MKLKNDHNCLPQMLISKQVMRDFLSFHCTSIPTRHLPWLVAEVAVSASPLSLLVEASLIQHPLLEGFSHFASILPRLPLHIASEATINASPLCPLLEAYSIQCYLIEDYGLSPHSNDENIMKAMNVQLKAWMEQHSLHFLSPISHKLHTTCPPFWTS